MPGLRSLARDLGLTVGVMVCGDFSAAIGSCRRAGIGKLRHVAVGQLSVQAQVKAGAPALYKVRGDANPADLCTKYLA